MLHRYLAAHTSALAMLFALAVSRLAGASPSLTPDDPAYLRLYELHDRGLIPITALATFRPISEADATSLFRSAAMGPMSYSLPSQEHGLWFRPIGRLSNRWSLTSDSPRAFSTTARPRSMDGELELTCEYQEGRPCGNGGIGTLTLDSAAGHGAWLSAFSRLRVGGATAGTHTIGPEIDRLYANIELGPAEFSIGRNVFAIGPGRHSQLLWGYNAPPLDHAALTVRALHLPGLPVAVGGGYVLGRLDSPQRYRNSLVSIARVHLEIADRLCLGMTNLLELGGTGAPAVGFSQFVEEHVHRTGTWPGEGVSNRRLGYDASLQIRPLKSLFYFEFVFEDWRAQFGSALRYDTDYLLGWATSGLGRGGNYGFVLEFLRTGVRSQEHGVFASGMTSGGRAVGATLGPDAISLYASPRWRLQNVLVLSPWTELIRVGSDTYAFPEEDAIVSTKSGLGEIRWRTGLGALALFNDGFWLEAGSFFEHVHNEAFQAAQRSNVGISASINWRGGTH